MPNMSYPLGARPEERERRGARIVARQAVSDHPQPVRRGDAPQVVDDLHGLARVHAGQVGEEFEAEVRVVVQLGHHRHDVARPDADLGLVMALPDRAGQAIIEVGFEPPLEASIH
jgi:hypothetical protein